MEQSDFYPYCLQYKLPENGSRRGEAAKVVTGGDKINVFYSMFSCIQS